MKNVKKNPALLAPGLQQSRGATLAAETDALLYLPYVWKKIKTMHL